jgi:hypothetical protein
VIFGVLSQNRSSIPRLLSRFAVFLLQCREIVLFLERVGIDHIALTRNKTSDSSYLAIRRTRKP